MKPYLTLTLSFPLQRAGEGIAANRLVSSRAEARVAARLLRTGESLDIRHKGNCDEYTSH